MFFSLLQNKGDLGWGVAVGLKLASFIVVFTSQLASKVGFFNLTNYDGSSALRVSWRICVIEKNWSCCEFTTTWYLNWTVTLTKER